MIRLLKVLSILLLTVFSAFFLLAVMTFFWPMKSGPVWKGGNLLISACDDFPVRLLAVETRAEWNERRFQDAGVDAKVYFRDSAEGGGFALMLRHPSPDGSPQDLCHVATAAGNLGFAKLSLSQATLTGEAGEDLLFETRVGLTEDYYRGEPLVMGYRLGVRISHETGAISTTLR